MKEQNGEDILIPTAEALTSTYKEYKIFQF